MRPYFTSSNAMSRRSWMVRQEVGVVTRRHKRVGPWRRLLPPGFPRAKRFKMSLSPSSRRLFIEDPPLGSSRLWRSLAWGRPSPGRGEVRPHPDTIPLILLILRHWAGPHLTVGVTDTIAQSRPTSLVSGGRAFWVASIAQAERDTRATHVHSNTGA